MKDFKEKLSKLPDKPGVYIMKDELGNIIYVGKAKSLKKRVSQYFGSYGQSSLKVKSMVKNIDDFEYIIVTSELESLILEANMIKENNPKYNILLRDDKQYPYIKISLNEKFPRVLKVRSVSKDGAKYYGPYPSAESVNESIDLFNEIFPIRDCKLNLEKAEGKVRPCLNYYIKRCKAPCIGGIRESDYLVYINSIMEFLEGKDDAIIKRLKEEMQDASKKMDYERAAEIRDKINALSYLIQRRQIADTASFDDRDIIAMARGEGEVCIQVFFVRNGKITGREHFFIQDSFMEREEDIIQAFIKQFYLLANFIPKEILIGIEIEEKELIEKWLFEIKGKKVELLRPKIGEKKRMLELAKRNAIEMLAKSKESLRRQRESNMEALEELCQVLKLEQIPKRIEAYDISNISGAESVGSMVVFEDGERKKSDYRKFRIRTVKGPDDYKSMEEVLNRRFSRAIKESEEDKFTSFSLYPDLILMDGGKGQVNIALKVLKKMGINILVAGLVKDDFHQTRGIIYDNEEYRLKVTSKAYRLIYKIQEEAHRFALNYHKSLRTKAMFASELDGIKGIGEKRKKALMNHFKSIKKIKEASLEDLIKVEGMNKTAAEELISHFKRSKNG